MLAEATVTPPIIAHQRPFEEWFVEAINDSALILMTSIGHRTGLFDAMAGLGWTTPEVLARETGLHERYVREWLAAMSTGRVLEIAEPDHYRLPEEHATYLRRDENGGSLAALAQYIGVLGGVEDDVVDRFRHGGGVPYERFNRFHEVMAEDSAASVVAVLDEAILPLIPGIQDRLHEGIHVLDVGCGRGLAMMTLAARYPKSRFVGFDLSEEAIAWARTKAERRSLTNVTFDVRDATDFDRTAEPEAFDFVTTFDAVHDQARPLAVLKGIGRTLRPDGVYLMQDIHAHSHVHENLDHPLAPLLYTVSCMHCMTVSLAQGGDGLGTMWGRETALEYLREAGFADVKIRQLEHDMMNDYYVARKRTA